jgi:ubiquinone/menaquinone biosynthesis C-methylase UbiE
LPDGREFIADLKIAYGIDYRAPCDARHTGLTSGSVDAVTSTDTLEHIPERHIGATLAECHRLLRDGGVMSCQIDYKDHYSYSDPQISPYHFFRYSDRRWALFSQSLHYQNRLRHSDYLRRIAAAGFELLEEFRVGGSSEDLETIRLAPLASRFRAYHLTDLATKSSVLSFRRI